MVEGVQAEPPSMLEAYELAASGRPHDRLPLTFEQRRRSRFKAVTAGGRTVAVILPRGTVLVDGSLLRTTDGSLIAVEAVPEDVSTVASPDALLLARIAYHLGDRHVRTQVGPGFIRYRHDRSTDELVRRLGAVVVVEEMPFEPEQSSPVHPHDAVPG